MELHQSFKYGALKLAGVFAETHREHGIAPADWQLITQDEHWTAEEARRVRGILASVIEVSMTLAGLPPVPLPGQYAAAIIAIVVAPCNRFVAAQRVPDTFDAAAASGLEGTMEIRPMKREQMFALVMAYSGGFGGEPNPRLGSDVKEMVKKRAA